MALGALVLLALGGCAAGENIHVANSGDAIVTVLLGDEDVGEVTPGGGAVLLDATECYQGPIVITFEGGRTIRLEGPICPGQTLSISTTAARIVEAADPA